MKGKQLKCLIDNKNQNAVYGSTELETWLFWPHIL